MVIQQTCAKHKYVEALGIMTPAKTRMVGSGARWERRVIGRVIATGGIPTPLGSLPPCMASSNKHLVLRSHLFPPAVFRKPLACFCRFIYLLCVICIYTCLSNTQYVSKNSRASLVKPPLNFSFREYLKIRIFLCCKLR